MQNKPIVSIICLTYNHAPYIRECLDGFLMQKTDFPFEVIIHDDASTDGTTEIVREYAAKYPDIIKPIIQTENQYSKHHKFGLIMEDCYSHSSGEYIALCEGDDYWTDCQKLQIQVNFMENHAGYTMCFHNALSKWEYGGRNITIFSNIEDRDYSGREVFEKWIVPTASTLIKASVFESPLYKSVVENKGLIYGDTPLFCTCGVLGKMRGFNRVMSVYRRNQNSVTNANVGFEYRLKIIKYHLAFKIFGKEYDESICRIATYLFNNLAIDNLLALNTKNFIFCVKNAFNLSKKHTIRFFIVKLPLKIYRNTISKIKSLVKINTQKESIYNKFRKACRIG